MNKFYSILFFAIIALATASCGKDETAENYNPLSGIKCNKELIGLKQKVALSAQTDGSVPKLKWLDNGAIINQDGLQINWIPTTIGKHKITADYTAANGKEIVTSSEFNVVNCDYAIALWGDPKQIVLDSEKGTLQNPDDASNMLYLEDVSGSSYYQYTRDYFIDNENKVSGGCDRYVYQIDMSSGRPSDYLKVYTYFKDVIDYMSTIYGPYDSETVKYMKNASEDEQINMCKQLLSCSRQFQATFNLTKTTITCIMNRENAMSDVILKCNYEKKKLVRN